MFGIGKTLFKNAKKIANQNQLEAIVAGALLVAAADGEIERAELTKLETLIANNDSLSAFRRADIARLIQRYGAMIDADFNVGRMKLTKEMDDVCYDSAEAATEVLLTMHAIANSDGEVEPAEARVLSATAKRYGVDLSEYGIAA